MSEVASIESTRQSPPAQANNTQPTPQVSQTNNSSLNQVAAANNNQSNLATSANTFAQELNGVNAADSVSATNISPNTSEPSPAPPEFHEAREKWRQNMESGASATYDKTFHNLIDGSTHSYRITEDANGISSITDLTTGEKLDPNSPEFKSFSSMTEKFNDLDEYYRRSAYEDVGIESDFDKETGAITHLGVLLPGIPDHVEAFKTSNIQINPSIVPH